jgi:hypothetical protein
MLSVTSRGKNPPLPSRMEAGAEQGALEVHLEGQYELEHKFPLTSRS